MKKYIHCIVNNDKNISPFSRKCLDSFKDYLTDYEIRYWTVDDIAKIDDDMAVEISKIENITYTMPATEFTSASKVKIPVSNITVDTVITIGLDTTSLTVEQYNAAGEAKFNPKIVEGGVEVSCFGQLPKIDIPVTLAVVRK